MTLMHDSDVEQVIVTVNETGTVVSFDLDPAKPHQDASVIKTRLEQPLFVDTVLIDGNIVTVTLITGSVWTAALEAAIGDLLADIFGRNILFHDSYVMSA